MQYAHKTARMMIRIFQSITALVALFAANGADNESGRSLQDQAICAELRGEIEVDITAQDIEGSCECFDMANGDTRLACRRNNACITSDGGPPMQGDFSAIFTKSGEGLSFTARTTIEYCFDYPSDMYDGSRACISTVVDGLGTVFTCEINVGNEMCNICRYCSNRLVSFDCSNLGYEERTACGDNNTDDSILKFLYNPELITGCSGGGSGGSDSSGGPGTSPSPTPSPAGGAGMANAIVAMSFCIIPVILMG